MAKIIRQNLVNSVRTSQMNAFVQLFCTDLLLLIVVLLLVWKGWYLLALLCLPVVAVVTTRGTKKVAIIKAGADGESETLALLRRLPADWTVLPDAAVAHRGHRSQIDYVVVAPVGVLIVEGKNVSGVISGKASDRTLDQYKPSRGGRPAEHKSMYNPLFQVQGHKSTLEHILQDAGIHTPVQTAVYFSNKNAEVRISGASGILTVGDKRPLDVQVRALLEKKKSKTDCAAVIRAIQQAMVP